MGQRMIIGLAVVAGCLPFGGGALAQTAPQHAYSDGFKLQPRPTEGENRTQTDPARVEPLLDALAKTAPPQASGPATDIYGRPLGGNPGLNPPGAKPTKP
jgi:hypothetical protein